MVTGTEQRNRVKQEGGIDNEVPSLTNIDPPP